MASTKTSLKTIRIANETVAYFDKLPLNRITEGVHALLECGHLKWDGEELTVNGCTQLPEEEELASLGSYFDMSLKDMISEFNRMLNEGDIAGEDKRLSVMLPEWAERIGDACHDANIPVEKAAERMIDMIQRGQV